MNNFGTSIWVKSESTETNGNFNFYLYCTKIPFKTNISIKILKVRLWQGSKKKIRYKPRMEGMWLTHNIFALLSWILSSWQEMMWLPSLARNTAATSFSTFLSHYNPTSCLVLSPFTLPNALHSRFTNISKIMIFSFPCIWLSFPKVFCYYDTLGLCFSPSFLPLSLSSHLISSLLFSQSSFTFFHFDVTAIYFCCLFLYFERIFAMGSPPSSSSLVFCWSELAAAELFLYGDLAT